MLYGRAMLRFLPHGVRGVLAALLIAADTAFVFVPILLLGLTKLAVPWAPWRKRVTRVLIGLADWWVSFNGMLFHLLHAIDWDIQGTEGLRRDEWYLVACNHRSWSDIPVVQYALNRRTPMLKFFLKQQLIWVPLLGLCWWALDFPFMKRYTREQIARDPSLRGKDLETTRRACEKFKDTPVAVFNFVEGTRLTAAKHAKQQSPYRHLLLPRAGGVGFVLGAMGDRIHTLLDVTVAYPGADERIWSLMSGRIPRVVVRVDPIPIPARLLGRDYQNDEAFRNDLQAWIGELWARKDALLEQMGAGHRT
jgi:1-acyl-sn-glycerol-3-phosphate acyltransferase